MSKDDSIDIIKPMKIIIDLMEVLNTDVKFVLKLSNCQLSLSEKKRLTRILVRTVGVSIDGSLSNLKLFVTRCAQKWPENLNCTDIEGLNTIRAKELTKNVYRALVKQFELEFDFNTGNSDWSNYMKFIKIRNRLTHPKSANCLKVSEDDLEIVKQAYTWFSLTNSAILLEIKSKNT